MAKKNYYLAFGIILLILLNLYYVSAQVQTVISNNESRKRIDLGSIIIETPVATTCIWDISSPMRKCYQNVYIEYKGSNVLGISTSQFKYSFKSNKAENIKILNPYSQFSKGNNYTLTYVFDYPVNSGEDWNISFDNGLTKWEIDEPVISACSVLNSSGVYTLNSSIWDSTSSACINITANDIELNCDGYTIDGINTVSSYGIYTNSSLVSKLKNITLKNCNISNWDTGIYLQYIQNSTIINVTTSNSNNGILSLISSFNQIINSTIKDNRLKGLYLFYSRFNNVTGSVIENNFITGIQISSHAGITTYNSSGNKIFNNIINNTLNSSMKNLRTFGINYTNYFNTTKIIGRNIINGLYISGNYWADYTETDYNGDGIGDIPYIINETYMIDYLPITSKTGILNYLICYYDNKPVYNIISNKINWICETNNNTACLSYIKESNGNITDVMPNIEYKEDYGEINSFNCPKICTIEFNTRNLLNNFNYTFGVRCENLDFKAEITPRYYLMQNQIVNRLIWTKENIPYLIMAFIILALLLFLLIWLFKKIMQELRFW